MDIAVNNRMDIHCSSMYIACLEKGKKHTIVMSPSDIARKIIPITVINTLQSK